MTCPTLPQEALVSALKQNFKDIIMKFLSFILITAAFLMLGTACTDDFESINENKNSPEEVEPQFLLTNIIVESITQNTYDQGFDQSNYFAHFSAAIDFGSIDRYEIGSNGTYWNNIFGLLTDIESIKQAEGSNEAYAAVGDIMRSFLFSQLTDMWTDVPYTEAVRLSEGFDTPAYDTQESIYINPETGILAVLKRSAAALENSNAVIRGDVMFNNELDKWVRFANSLQVRYIMRISKQLTDFSELQALAGSGKLMRSNDDNAVLPYLSAAPNQFPFFLAASGANDEHVMTFTIDSVLSQLNDPRIGVYYKPTLRSIANGNPEFRGVRNGQSRETVAADTSINAQNISLFGSIFRDVPDGIDAQFMQYAELQFALAEAVQRNYISGDAQVYYENGIRAAFEYYEVELPADYLIRPNVAFDTVDDLTKIMTQKWISLINVGHEAWFNIRRTGIPALKSGPDAANDGRYPVRYLYPESEQATNNANFTKAASRIGGNTINSKGWWEKD